MCPHPQPPRHKVELGQDYILSFATQPELTGSESTKLTVLPCYTFEKKIHVQPVRGFCREAQGQIPQSCAENYCWELSL